MKSPYAVISMAPKISCAHTHTHSYTQILIYYHILKYLYLYIYIYICRKDEVDRIRALHNSYSNFSDFSWTYHIHSRMVRRSGSFGYFLALLGDAGWPLRVPWPIQTMEGGSRPEKVWGYIHIYLVLYIYTYTRRTQSLKNCRFLIKSQGVIQKTRFFKISDFSCFPISSIIFQFPQTSHM